MPFTPLPKDYIFSGWVVAPNISGGFHGIEIDIMRACDPKKDILLTLEPSEVILVFRDLFPESNFTVTSYDDPNGAGYHQDLNIPIIPNSKYDIVLSQATLEHVFNPCMAVENFARWTRKGGHIVIHTVGPKCPVHRFPVDCIRFNPDWYTELERYIPVKLVYYKEDDTYHQFSCYEKLED